MGGGILNKYRTYLIYNGNDGHFWDTFGNSVKVFAVNTFGIFVILILSAVGFSYLRQRLKGKLMLLLTYILMISATALMYYGQNADVTTTRMFTWSASSALRGILFGCSIFISEQMFNNLKITLDNVVKLSPNKNRITRTGFAILALSMLSSLTAWFQQDYVPQWVDVMPRYFQSLTIYQYFLRCTEEKASLLVVSMLIPIIIVCISIPCILRSVEE